VSSERKIENAFKHQPSKVDMVHMDAIRLMSAVVVGVGMISKKDQLNSDDAIIYLVGHLILSLSI
jgi:hypothetical protein